MSFVKPPWADIVVFRTKVDRGRLRVNHIRSGWSADGGYRAWCGTRMKDPELWGAMMSEISGPRICSRCANRFNQRAASR